MPIRSRGSLAPAALLLLACGTADAGDARGRLTQTAPALPASSPAPSDTVRIDAVGEFHASTLPDYRGGGQQFGSNMRPRGGVGSFALSLSRPGGGRPAVGRYRLAPATAGAGDGRLYAVYRTESARRADADTARGYVSVDGEVEVTASSPDRIAGTMRFTGAEYFAISPGGRSGSGSPAAPTPGGPTVAVIAAFEARPFDQSTVVSCVGTGGPSVVVTVRDREGRPAAAGASLVIVDGAFRDSVGPTASWDGLNIGAGERRPGRYTVRVSKPGYRTATLTDVIAKPTGDARCAYAEESGRAEVTLDLLPGAPAVRSVVVVPDVMGLSGIPGYEMEVAATVDAAPGRSRAVRWTSSDPTLLVVRPLSDSTAVVIPQCRATGGRVTITAVSVSDPRVRGAGHVHVTPPTDDARLGPPAASAAAQACVRRLRSGR